MSAAAPGTTSIAYRRASVVALLEKITAIVGPDDVPGEDLIDWFMSDLREDAKKLLAEITPKPPIILTLPSGRKRLICPWCGHDGREVNGDPHLYTEEIGSTRTVWGFDAQGNLLIAGDDDLDYESSTETRIMCGGCRAEFGDYHGARDFLSPHVRDHRRAVEAHGDDEKPAPHTKDADCAGFLLPDNTCAVCGVEHGDPCTICGGRGYHVEGCGGAA